MNRHKTKEIYCRIFEKTKQKFYKCVEFLYTDCSSSRYAGFSSEPFATECIRSSSVVSISLTSSRTERADVFVLSVAPSNESTKKLAACRVVEESLVLPYRRAFDDDRSKTSPVVVVNLDGKNKSLSSSDESFDVNKSFETPLFNGLTN